MDKSGSFCSLLGDRNVLSDATIARNTVSGNTFFGINVNGGFGGADENSLDLRIQDNTVTDNGIAGIRVIAGQDNSSNNHVVARIRGNTVERNRLSASRLLPGRARSNFPTGTSNNNVLDVRIEQNTVRSQHWEPAYGSEEASAARMGELEQSPTTTRHMRS